MKPKEILDSLQTRAKKRFGQNFLTDNSVILDMVKAADVKEGERIVEIGSGLGALTEELVGLKAETLAIEADRDLATYLRERNLPRVTVVTADALILDWTISLTEPYKVIGNIPYSITSPLLRKIFALEMQPSTVVLLVQKEMAERIVAAPGNNDRGFLTLITEAHGSAKIVRTVKPGSFYPAPHVDSAIICYTPGKNRSEEIFWPALETAFSHKRQTFANSVSSQLHIPKSQVEAAVAASGLNPLCRPADLSFEEWVLVSNKVKELI